ncbi:sensor histidine kinase [Phenylobacterium montanum]|uniref:histidine kinase n=2 Tax=Phenylobacterium montanum TaxID=2823693 RepID=A0A975IXF2_9CAUL|nr:sensor histidine kinase [Caulobacter sp. S6]
MPGTLATIRVRLGAAMAVALAPVLLLGAAETTVAYQKDAQEQRASLGLAAERSAATARARMESASVLLETLAPESVGLECAQRLSEVTGRLAGYDNLIRFDRFGRVACAARSVPADALRRDRAWFIRLSQGMQSTIIRSPEGLGGAPALLAAERADDRNGAFDGALVALINLDSLRPNLADRALPRGTEVAIIDEQGRYISRTRPGAFGAAGTEVVSAARNGPGPYIYFGKDQDGESRVFSAAPLTGEVSVILSAPAESLFSWAGLNPLSSFMFPLLAFTLALTAVWVVTERVVVRWLAYLNRIAAIYAKGRLSVRPSQASHAPPEIRELAVTMADMAEAIAARDQSLRDSLTEKDALLREIHHRVKNNLQVISSLLNLQERSLADPAARAAMAETRQRVGALALIYRALYQGSDMRRVDLRQFLSDLIGQMVIEQQAKGMAVRTELTADELTIDPDKLAPLALFAVEAISNAQKHALAAHGGLLSVRFEVDGAEATLSISDEGGDAEPSLGGGIGVGRALMSAFARQLRGRMELAPNGRGGATARLIFPTPGLEKAPPRRTRQAGEGNQPTAQAS